MKKTIKPDTGITAMKWTRELQRTSSTGCPASHTQRAAQGKLQETDFRKETYWLMPISRPRISHFRKFCFGDIFLSFGDISVSFGGILF